jgi:hypothetical protein
LLWLLALGLGELVWAWFAPGWFAAFVAPDVTALALGTVLVAVGGCLRARTHAAPMGTHAAPMGTQQAASLLVVMHVLLVVGLPLWLRGIAALLILGMPGALAALLVFRDERDPVLRCFLMLAAAIALPIALLLALHALPGPLTSWATLLAFDAMTVVLLVVWARQVSPVYQLPNTTHPYLALFAVLVIGAVLRFSQLGASEFQGDEAWAMLAANGVRFGRDEVLLLRPKGPAEVLLPAGPLLVLGTINEFIARLPFALAGLTAVLGAYLLGTALAQYSYGTPLALTRRPFRFQPQFVGLMAALIVALDGYPIAFSRIVQYQSVVMLMMLAALWCCWRFFDGAERPLRYLLAAAGFAAVGLLGHYDYAAVAPALAWLVLAGGMRRSWRWRDWLRFLLPPIALGVLLLTSFYLPFVLNESFTRTADYLVGRTRSDDFFGSFFNNLNTYFRLVTFYNSVYQIAAYAIIMVLALIVWLLRFAWPRPLAWLPAFMLGLAALTQIALSVPFPLPGGGSWALLAFGLPLLWLALAPGLPGLTRATLIWFAFAFCAYSFLFADPRTHYYTMHLPAALLIALALGEFTAWLRQSRFALLRFPFSAASVALLLAAFFYAHVAYLRQVPEYHRQFGATRLPFYHAPYQSGLPDGGFFGFVHRDAWPVIGELYQQGVLRGTFDTNSKEHLAGWYTRDAPQCAGTPDYQIVALNEENIFIPTDYDLFGWVTIDGVRSLDIYSRAPVAEPRALTPAHAGDFAARPIEDFSLSALLDELVPQQMRHVEWPGGATLNGFDLSRSTLDARGAVLTVYWDASARSSPGYDMAAVLLDADGTASQPLDLLCRHRVPGIFGAEADELFDFAIPGSDTLASGVYSVAVGLYNRDSASWLPLADGTTLVPLTTVRVP